jgi:hypothetical protein
MDPTLISTPSSGIHTRNRSRTDSIGERLKHITDDLLASLRQLTSFPLKEGAKSSLVTVLYWKEILFIG